MSEIKETFTYSEVQNLIQIIWSEFVELGRGMHTPYFLRHIIELEIEGNPIKPVQIFTPESKRETNAGLLIAQNKDNVKRLAELESENKRMKDALKIYADEKNWVEITNTGDKRIYCGKGNGYALAREVLKEIEGNDER
jgi:hypothetical protein